MKTVYVLVTRMAGMSKYIFRSTNRTYDNKKLIELTDDIDKAQNWDTDREAKDFISKCVTNEKNYIVETHQIKQSKTETMKFGRNAMDAML